MMHQVALLFIPIFQPLSIPVRQSKARVKSPDASFFKYTFPLFASFLFSLRSRPVIPAPIPIESRL